MSLHERKLPQRDTYTTKKVNCVLWKGEEAAAHVILGHHHPTFPIIWVNPVKLCFSSTHVLVYIDIALNATTLCNETETVCQVTLLNWSFFPQAVLQQLSLLSHPNGGQDQSCSQQDVLLLVMRLHGETWCKLSSTLYPRSITRFNFPLSSAGSLFDLWNVPLQHRSLPVLWWTSWKLSGFHWLSHSQLKSF